VSTFRAPNEVAARCLCLELLFQRYLLEIDTDEDAGEREQARATWLSKDGDLGIAPRLTGEERTLLGRPVGQLSEDDLDTVYGRALGAAVLLWGLGRAPGRPTFTTAESIVAEHGLLGDGSVSAARAAADAAALRPEAELDAGLADYARLRGKAREVDDPERNFAGVAAHHVEWMLDPSLPFDDVTTP
jgi:hypothetical protein